MVISQISADAADVCLPHRFSSGGFSAQSKNCSISMFKIHLECKFMRFFGSQRLENALKVFLSFFILFEFSGISFFIIFYPPWFWCFFCLSFFYPFFILLDFGVFLFILFFIIFLSFFYHFFILLAAKWIKIGFPRYKRQRAEEKCRISSFFYPFLSFSSCKIDQNWLLQVRKAKGWGKV